MYTLILHLSDLHVSNSEDQLLQSADALLGALHSQIIGVTAILVLVNGDLVDRGNCDAFVLAERFLQELSNKIKAEWNPLFKGIFLTPGNHDLDHSNPNPDRPASIKLMQEANSQLPTEMVSHLETCSQPLHQFYQLAASLGHTLGSDATDKLFHKKLVECQGHLIELCIANTSILSMPADSQGQLRVFLPKNAFDSTPSLRILMMHHALHWIQAENAIDLRRQMDEHVDIVLTGHDHQHHLYSSTDQRNRRITQIEGNALQMSGLMERPSQFAIILLDAEQKRVSCSRYSWIEDMFEEVETSNWRELDGRHGAASPVFEIEKEFYQYLDDPDVTITHPVVGSLKLSDHFLYQDCSLTSLDREVKQSGSIEVPSRDLLDQVLKNRRCLFLGISKSGRTALLKTLYKDLHAKGITPVLFTEKFPDKLSPDRLDSSITKCITQQYGKQSASRVKQLTKDKVAILIDDLHLRRINGVAVNSLLETLEAKFGTVILTADTLYPVEELLDTGNIDSLLTKYSVFNIRRCGQAWRGRLIRHWIWLGREEELCEADVSRGVRDVEHVLDTLLRKGVVPQLPFFVLSLLQANSANKPLSLETGSLGYHYEFLISSAIEHGIKSVMGNSRDILPDMVKTCLSFLAFQAHAKKSLVFSVSELEDSVALYKSRFDLNFNAGKFVDVLIASRAIVVRGGDRALFTYRYVYYFFLARFVANGRMYGAEPVDLQTVIESALGNMLIEDNAQLILFYVYLTVDSSVVERLILQVEELFTGIDLCTLEEDIEWMRESIDIVPALPNLDSDPKVNREKFLEELDRAMTDEAVESEISDSAEDEGREVLLSQRYIQVLGQLLRSQPGSLDAETKLRIARACMTCSLKLMRKALGHLELSNEAIANMLVEDNPKHVYGMSDDEIRKGVGDLFSYLAFNVIYGLLAGLSIAIGAPQLSVTLQRLLDSEVSLPGRLLAARIQLDHWSSFPESTIISSYRALRQRNAEVAVIMLKMMVAEHFYLFTAERKVKAAVCGELGIVTNTIQSLMPRN